MSTRDTGRYSNYGEPEINALRKDLGELRSNLFLSKVETGDAVCLTHAIGLLDDYAKLFKGRKLNALVKEEKKVKPVPEGEMP